jgi:hypothetical protein
MGEERGQRELESKIAEWVRTYVVAAHGDDSSQEQEALRWLCSGLEWLLQRRLEGREGTEGWWVDGIIPATDMLPDAIQVISAVEVSIRGYAIWAKASRAPFWIDPFFGIVRISQTSDSIVGYELHFVDAARGPAKVPFGKHLRWQHWFFPPEWLMTFSEGVFTKGHLQ